MGWLARRAHVLGVALPLMMSHEEGFSEYDGVPGMLRREWRAIGLSGTVLLEHVRAHIENTPLIADEVTLVNCIETHRVSSHDESHKIARFAAVARWVEMLCKERPRILIVDDFQWDTETGEFLRYLKSNRPHLPLLILIGMRSEDEKKIDQYNRHPQEPNRPFD